MRGVRFLGFKSLHILVRSLMLGVGDFMMDFFFRLGLTFLGQRLKVEISMLVIAVEWLMVELMVLRAAMVSVDDGSVVGSFSVVTLSNAVMFWGVMDGPGVHFWTGFWQFVAVVSSIIIVSSLIMVIFILISYSSGNFSMGCLMVPVGIMDLSAVNFSITNMSVQGKSLVYVVMLNSVLG